MKATTNATVYLFLKLNIWLSFTSILMVTATAMALSISLSTIGIGLLLPGLLFYFIYTEDRRNTSPEDHINQPYRTQMVEKYQDVLLHTEILALTAYELIIIFFIYSTPEIGLIYFLLGQLPLAVLIMYDQLKRYPTFDSIAVGTTWSFAIMFAVLISANPPISSEFLLISLAWLGIVFAGVESRNIQDIKGDTETKKATLAGYLGKQHTQYMNVSLKLTATALFWIIADPMTTAVVILYLLLLQTFRGLTQRAQEITTNTKATPTTTMQ